MIFLIIGLKDYIGLHHGNPQILPIKVQTMSRWYCLRGDYYGCIRLRARVKYWELFK